MRRKASVRSGQKRVLNLLLTLLQGGGARPRTYSPEQASPQDRAGDPLPADREVLGGC